MPLLLCSWKEAAIEEGSHPLELAVQKLIRQIYIPTRLGFYNLSRSFKLPTADEVSWNLANLRSIFFFFFPPPLLPDSRTKMPAKQSLYFRCESRSFHEYTNILPANWQIHRSVSSTLSSSHSRACLLPIVQRVRCRNLEFREFIFYYHLHCVCCDL